LDWKEIVEEIAGSASAYGGQVVWFFKAARACGLSARQIEALWRGEYKDPKFSISVKVLEAAARARKEANDLATKFETAAGALHAKDQDFYGADILALVDAARRVRGMGRA